MTHGQLSRLVFIAGVWLAVGPVQAQEPECEPAPELCNDLDDDCDGRVDEDFELDEPCFDGVGACMRPGYWKCFQGRRACKTPPLGEPGEEICNDRDDDCDGIADENLDCGGCGGPEICNGRDDDCDLRVDEGFNTGAPCMAGEGECATEGTLECDEGGGVYCNAPPPQEPGEELCNGLDDDCDGLVDEGYDVGGDCAEGEGACRDTGKWICAEDGSRECDAEPSQPIDEICNKRDDDCDGAIDEGDVCVVCEPSFEMCNNLDDDCDGVIDEGLDQGEPCSAGVGACRNNGELVCRDGQYLCTAEPSPPGQEICNELDDDCDGNVDEGFPVGDECLVGVGLCVNEGRFVCRDGDAVCDAVPLNPQPELCNGLDDDCDDKTDETFPLGDPCSVGDGACAADGEIVCDDQGEAKCNAEPGDPRAEICNELDDDCDGQIDEGFPVGDMCGVGVGLCANEGEIICRDGQAVCGAEPLQPRDEQCNQLDDDCDGNVDEGVLNACGGCGAVPEEMCNDRDDDCDGQIDEGCGPACQQIDGVCRDECPNGFVCDPGCIACVPEPPPECDRQGDRCVDTCPEGLMCDDDCASCVEIPCLRDPLGGDECIDTCPQGTVCDQDCQACVRPCQAAGDQCIENCPAGMVCDEGCGECIMPCVGNQEICADNCPRGSTCDQDCLECVPDIPCSNEGGVCQDNCPQGSVCDEMCEGCVPAPGCSVDPFGRCDDNCPQGMACDQDCGECVPTCDLADGVCADNCPAGLVCDGQCAECVPACVQRGDLCVDACPAGQACNNDCTRCVEDDGCIPSPEVCDGRDNDCNGLVDDGFAGMPERCDQQDNDCDGQIDEGVGEPCFAGEGACRGQGRMECQPDGSMACTAEPGDPQPERCNNVDDDCDGQVDEGLGVGEPCAMGGACDGRGQVVCDGQGGTTCDLLAGDSGPEVCDGTDNDCDGAVDERADCCQPGEVRPCGVPVGVCRAGEQACGADFLWGECSGNVDQRPELCDAQDNDCDGAVDENFQALGEPCVDGAGACAQEGEFVCGAGGEDVVCSAALNRPPEVCDGTDTDCDGRIDEGVQNACGNCDIDCIGDRIDNDCDGQIDERAVGEQVVRCGDGDPGGGDPAGANGGGDFKTAESNSGGCTATGAPAAPLWLLIGLPFLVRRRRR